MCSAPSACVSLRRGATSSGGVRGISGAALAHDSGDFATDLQRADRFYQVGGVERPNLEVGLIGRQRAPNIICIPAAQGDAHNIRPVLVKPERKLDTA